ncbi:MAG: metallophosphoesterase [Pseudomonadota bacterium]|nr:metallophosphoesterase [Pseudomonadota bacterium]
MRTYAIGDIHGQLSELERAHDLIDRDRAACDDADAPVVHIGDLCDRGPATRGVIDFLMGGLAAGKPWVVLTGNHDRMMTAFLEPVPNEPPRMPTHLTWLNPRLGGDTTLASYGVDTDRPVDAIHTDARARVPAAHVAFLEALPVTYERGDCFFCHAGVRPGVPLAEQDEQDLIWIREPFLSSTEDHGKLIVHGHTPVDVATHYGNRLNIDSGAGYFQPMSAVVIEGREAWLLTEGGRAVLPRG